MEIHEFGSEDGPVDVANPGMGSEDDVFVHHREVWLVGHELYLDLVVGGLARLLVGGVAAEGDVGVDDVVVVDGAVHAGADRFAVVDDAGVVGVARGGEPARDDHVVAFVACLAHLDDLGIDLRHDLDEVDAEGGLHLVFDVVGDFHAVGDVADGENDALGGELGPEFGGKGGKLGLGLFAVEVPVFLGEIGEGRARGGALDVAEEAGLHHLVGRLGLAVEEVDLPDEGDGVDRVENRPSELGGIEFLVLAGEVELAVAFLADLGGVHVEHTVPDREAGLRGDVDTGALDGRKVELGEVEGHVDFTGDEDVVDLGLLAHRPELDVLEGDLAGIAPPGVVAGEVDFLGIGEGNELVGTRAGDDLGAIIGARGFRGLAVFDAGAVVGKDVEGGAIGGWGHVLGAVSPGGEGDGGVLGIPESAPGDLHGVGIDLFHREDRAEHRLGTRLGVVENAVEGKDDVIGGEIVAVVELDALAEFDGVGGAVLGDEAVLHRGDDLGQSGIELVVGGHIDEGFVDLAHHLGLIEGGVDVRIEGLGRSGQDEDEGVRVAVAQGWAFGSLSEGKAACDEGDDQDCHEFFHANFLPWKQ